MNIGKVKRLLYTSGYAIRLRLTAASQTLRSTVLVYPTLNISKFFKIYLETRIDKLQKNSKNLRQSHNEPRFPPLLIDQYHQVAQNEAANRPS